MFSVVVPVYNNRATLARTVASVLVQRYTDFELIIIDDGSTDDSLSAIATIDDPRLRTITQERAGPGPARNAGVEASRSDWIAFLDGDDIWLNDHLEELDAIRRAHPEAGLIGTAFVVAPAGAIPERLPPRTGNIGVVRYFDAIGNGDDVLRTSTAALRKAAWRSVGGFGPFPRGEDTNLWVRIALRWPVAASTKVTAIYLTGTGGISDRQKTPWLGKPLHQLSDLSPAVAALVPEMNGSPNELNGWPERYAARHMYWCLHGSARAGDIATLRALRKFYRHRASIGDRIILEASLLPAPLAKAIHFAVYAAQAATRRLVRVLNSSGGSAGERRP
jgi:hypothetical protein